ncbi:MAG: dTDP-4-amino-4,6-dideoxygalactose transaminase [Chloroflexi bacterium]|nr:dTDP-4-amino-4,6-dideoxygalactose transaminase [Chloroflexota bacterium]
MKKLESHNLIDFNRPYIASKQFDYVREAIQSGHISGDGQFTRKCHAWLEDHLGVKKALLTTNCTHALEMSALLLDLKPGDEVITPSFTFVSTVNAFILRGAKPVFADIRTDTLNIDEEQIEALVNERTRAIFVVHYAGVGCEMDKILEVASRLNLQVVEDNAHGLFGKYRGKMLGTFGSMACQSFHETKNISSGEGGALLINDAKLMERAEIIREKGTDRSRFFRGQVDKYSWVDLGSSYLPSEIIAAVLFSQLEEAEKIQERRRKIWETYDQSLSEWAAENDIKLPTVPEYCEQSYHLFYMLLPNLNERQRFIQFLRENDIYSVFHYVPLHTSTMGRSLGYKDGDMPITEDMSDRLVRLPFYFDLSESDQKQVISVIKEFYTKR